MVRDGADPHRPRRPAWLRAQLAQRSTYPALAFDSGFVKGYLAGEALPAGTPTMATLLPVADRCLAQSEPNTQLCSSVGVVLGARAAHGELVPTPAE